MYDEPYSRAVAEVYYMMANACDFDAKKALTCYYKTYLILFKHLQKEYNKEFEINIEFEDVKLEDIKIESELLGTVNEDNDKKLDLKEILRELKQKVN